ncbi:ImuA family protein [Falsiroseomonas sp. E2-1-a4]|uniref:ImuA family protein n=1 Tax=Falsiroseomonas sp. E2-1-a4 TaxID=3239299 RepID=UPI003F385288
MQPAQTTTPDPPPLDPAPLDQATVLAALRARVARLEGLGRARHGMEPVPVAAGIPLPGGGLARAAMHEVAAISPGAAAAFCAVLLARSGGTVLWIASGGSEGLQAWPPGLARCGLSPANLVLVRAERWADALWAMEEALRCPAVTGALLAAEDAARLDLTATRRLQLAAETGGALGLVLRPDAPNPDPSAAASHWRVGPLPSGGGHGLEDPRWQLELLRARGGRPGGPWAVTWRAASGTLDMEEAEAPAAEVRRARRGR